MKKILILILTLCMSAFLGCSCGGNDGPIVETLPPAPEVEATLSLNASEISLLVGEEKYISAQTNNLEGYTLAFASNNEDVALVDNSGKITAYSEGTAVITATYTNGDKIKSATCNVAVGFASYVPFLEIEGGLQDVTQISLNDKLSITPFITFNNLSFYDATYEITSLNESIIEINEDNELVAKGVGETQVVIKATWRNKTSDDFKTLTNTFKVKVINSVVFLSNGTPLEDVNLFTRNSFFGKTYNITAPLLITATVNGEAFTGEISVSIENGGIASYASSEIQSKGFGETVAKVTLVYNGETYGDTFKIKVERPIVEIEEEVLKFSTFSGMFKDVTNNLQNTTLVEKFFEDGKTIHDAYQYMEDGTIKELTFSDGCVYGIKSSDDDIAGTAKIILGTTTERYILNLETYGQLFATPDDLLYLVVTQEKKLTGYCELLNDIDATGIYFDHDETLFAKAGFHGVFEGKGHVISNVTVTKIDKNGYGESLFGAIGGSAVLRNFALYNLNCTESYFIAQSATDGHTIENVYINVNSETSTPKGITNAMGSKNNYKAIVVDYLASNKNMGLTDAGVPNFAIGHNGSKAEYSSFAGNIYRNSGFNKVNDNTWKDVYVFSKLPVLNYSNITLNATDVSTFNMPSTFDSTIKEDGNMATRVTAIGYAANETVDLWGNEINDEAPVIDSNPNYSSDADPYNIKRFFFNVRFTNVYRYDSYEDLAATKDDQGTTQWDNFDSKYWLISNGVPYFKALYNTHINVGFYNSNNEYVDDVVFDEETDKFTVLFKDGGALSGTPTLAIESNDYIEAVDNVLKVKAGANIPAVPHEFVVTASQTINGVNYVKTKVIKVAKQITANEDRIIFDANSGKLLTNLVQGNVVTFTVSDGNSNYSANVDNGVVTDVIVRNANVGNTPELRLQAQVGNNTFIIDSTDGEFDGVTVYVETTTNVYKFTNIEFVSKVLSKVEDLAYLSVGETTGNTAPYVILGNSIDAKGYKHSHNDNIVTNNRLSYSFNGIFDGKGYSIGNLDLTDNKGGLFGAFDYSAVVRNVGLYNVKAVNSPILAYKAKLASVVMVEIENNQIKYDKNGSKVYPYMQFKNVYVKLADGSKNVKGLISNFDNNHTYEMSNIVVDYQNAPNVTVEGGKVYENGVEVTDTIGILQASTVDKAFGFNSRLAPKFTNNYFITSYPLMYRNAEFTPQDIYIYNGLVGEGEKADRLSNETTFGKVWGMARNSVAPNGVTKPVKDSGADVNAFSYILDLRSEQYATTQALKDANKDLTSFNDYWDVTSGAPVWKTAIDVAVDYKIVDVNSNPVDDVEFTNPNEEYTVTFVGIDNIVGVPTLTIEENAYIEVVNNVLKVKNGAVLPIAKEELKVKATQTISGKVFEKEFIISIYAIIEGVDKTGYLEDDGTIIVDNLNTSDVKGVYYKNESVEFDVVNDNIVATLSIEEQLGTNVAVYLLNNDNEYKVLSLKYVTEYITTVQEMKDAVEIRDLSSEIAKEGYIKGDLYNDGYYVLGCDLDFTGYKIEHFVDSATSNVAKYGADRPFMGVFDGQGYALKNVEVTNGIGIFGTFAGLNVTAVKNLAIIGYNFPKATNNNMSPLSVLGASDSLGSSWNDGGTAFENLYITLGNINNDNNVNRRKTMTVGQVVNGRTTFKNIIIEADITTSAYENFEANSAYKPAQPVFARYLSAHVYTPGGVKYKEAEANALENVIIISKDTTGNNQTFRMSSNSAANEFAVAYNDKDTAKVVTTKQTTNFYYPEYSYVDEDGKATFIKPENYTGANNIVIRRYDDYVAFASDSKTDKTSLNKFTHNMWVVSNGAVYYKAIYNECIKSVVYDSEDKLVDEIVFDDDTDVYTFGFIDNAIISGDISITLTGNTSCLLVDGNKVKVNGAIIGNESVEIAVSQEINGKTYTAVYTATITNEKHIDTLVYFDASTGLFDSEEIKGTIETATVTYGGENYSLTVNNGKIEGITVENRTVGARSEFNDISAYKLFIKTGESEGDEVGFTIADDGDFNGATAELRTIEGKVYKLSNVEFVTKVIKTQSDLAVLTVSQDAHFDFGYYVLANNINVVDDVNTEGVNEAIAIPHRTYYNKANEIANFNGVFDGKGYTISNLKVNDYGMFASVGAYAIIRNFALNNLDATNAPFIASRLKTQTISAGNATSPAWLKAKLYTATKLENVYIKLSSNTSLPRGLYYDNWQTWIYKFTNVVIDWQNAPAITVKDGKIYEGEKEITSCVGIYTAGGDQYAGMMGERPDVTTTYTISSYPLMIKVNGTIQMRTSENTKYYTTVNGVYTNFFSGNSESADFTTTVTKTLGFGRNVTTAPAGVVAMTRSNASTDIAMLNCADVASYTNYDDMKAGLNSSNLNAFNNSIYWDTANGYPVWKNLPQA